MSKNPDALSQVVGSIERITFHNIDSGFTVAQLQQSGRSDLVCIVGKMPGIQPGETVRCYGHWTTHLIHGKQFEINSFRVEAPSDIIGIKKYLGSGLIKGIGPTYAKRIVDKFGIETLNIIDQSPERLKEVAGLGKKRSDQIINCWTEQRSIRDVMIFLQGNGISPAFAQKIFKKYGGESIKIVKDNPYRLARDVFGIGFKSADSVAQKMGISKDSEKRVDAGVEYALTQLSNDGHVCYPVDEFIKEAEQILEVPQQLIESRLPHLHQEQRIELAQLVEKGKPIPFIWYKSLFLAEVGIARELKRVKRHPCSLRDIDTEKAIIWVQEKLHIQLAQNQKEAVSQAFCNKILIITGGPGTGKSTITKAILRISEKLTQRICLVAPTGRASKRMSEITERKATTIHSLLEYDFKKGGFKRNLENPIECDLIIVDEASMIDTYLMNNLLKAIPKNARIIFIGDIDQLPSVGPGNVLKDLIGSRSISVVTLDEVFRQAAGSAIITNAHRINKGDFPNLYNGPTSDFFFMEHEEGNEILDTIVKLVCQRLPKKYGFNALEDIQVLAPMKKGIIGTENLNQALQQMLNPQETSLMRGGYKLQCGDKVMQIRNNYKKEVFNGDIGFIKSIDTIDHHIIVQFDEKEVVYEFSELDELVLAYAISIHKFQGSERPCIVMPIHTSHFMLLHRNLLYTGITRGKKLVVLVGTKKAIALAIHNDKVKKRYTALQQAIMELL